mgnify:CR=1 FL=1
MKIKDKAAQQFINDKLSNRQSFYLEGVAGCGKSSCLWLMREHGISSVLMLAPTNQLVLRHRERFSDAVDNFEAATYASTIEKVKRGKLEYDADIKTLKTNAEYIVLDEVLATDYKLIKAVLEQAKLLNIPVILLGDFNQSTRHSRLSREYVFKGLEGLIIDESLRGTESNRGLINGFYQALQEGLDLISTSDIATLIHHCGGKIAEGYPTSTKDTFFGYTKNAVQDELIKRLDFTEKIFSGKVSYKKDGSLSKKWDNAPIVSQERKELLSRLSGIEVPFATPRQLISHITCIGVELPEHCEYAVVLEKDAKVLLSNIYTLLSRQLDPSQITIYLIDRVSDLIDRIPSALQTIEGDKLAVLEPIFSVSVDPELVGLKSDDKLSIYTNYPSFTKTLKSLPVSYMPGITRMIVADKSTIRVGGVDAHDLKDAIAQAKALQFMEQMGIDIEKPETAPQPMVRQVLGEVAQYLPGLVCNPLKLFKLGDTFINHKNLSQAVSLEVEQQQEAYEEVVVSTDDLLSASVDEFLECPNTDYNYTGPAVYEFDLMASYWQILAQYPEYIGYGDLTEYSEDAELTYYLASLNDREYLLNSRVVEAYNKLGVEFDTLAPLASRKSVGVMPDEAKQLIYRSRYIRFDKSRLVQWGDLKTPLLQEAQYVRGEEAQKVIINRGQDAGAYCLLIDILAIQSLLVNIVKLQTGGQIVVDGVKSESPISVNFPSWIRTPDYRITKSYTRNGEIVKETVEARGYGIMEVMVELLHQKLEGKPKTYTTKEIQKIKDLINSL